MQHIGDGKGKQPVLGKGDCVVPCGRTAADPSKRELAGLGGDVLRSREGRQQVFAVRAGPFATVAEADAALRRALGAGVVDARITVE